MNLNLVSWGTDVTMEFKWVNGNWNASTETGTKNSTNILQPIMELNVSNSNTTHII